VIMPLSDPAIALADRWQRNFPLTTHPFAVIGKASQLPENDVIAALQGLHDTGILGRIGAAVRPNTVGASTLAAIAVPPERLDEIVAIVNAEPCVNHNYERENEINLWFVVTTDCLVSVTDILARIEKRTGLHVLYLPLERSYHIDLGFRLAGNRREGQAKPAHDAAYRVGLPDRRLLCALEEGLSFTAQPYLEIARQLGWIESQVLFRLNTLVENGIISRFGCILRHRKIGFKTNAMAVWDVPDDKVDAIAEKLSGFDAVTLCYRRTRRPPIWPYNLFAMIHGRERSEVMAEIAKAELATGLGGYEGTVLFSRRCFKQRGATFLTRASGAA
jgi:DNA-binding Lrp family transcriptional regulator